jgi:hypothetical protein
MKYLLLPKSSKSLTMVLFPVPPSIRIDNMKVAPIGKTFRRRRSGSTTLTWGQGSMRRVSGRAQTIYHRCGDRTRCGGCRCHSHKASCRVQGPGMLHGPCFEIPREILDITNVLRDEETCCWLDEVSRFAIGKILDRAPLA